MSQMLSPASRRTRRTVTTAVIAAALVGLLPVLGQQSADAAPTATRISTNDTHWGIGAGGAAPNR